MNSRRTANRATRLFTLVALVALLLLAAAPPAHPLAARGMFCDADGSWTDQAPAASPSARWGLAMAYLGGDRVLLFGGRNDSGPNGETWVYDLSANTWANRAPAVAPSVRHSHAMASLGGGYVLLFGGWDGSGYNGETWLATGFFIDWHRTYLPVVAK